MLRLSLSIAAVALVLLTAAPRSDAAPDPRAFVGDIGTEGIQTLGPNVPLAERTARFDKLFESDFDVPGIGRFVIGRYWHELNPDQQQEFLQLFKQYTVASYAAKLGEYGGARLNVTGVQNDGAETVVASEVERSNGQPVKIDWHLIDAGGQLKVSDVYVNGVSMKVTQRDEFASIIQNNGGRPEALLAVLREQLRNPGQPVR